MKAVDADNERVLNDSAPVDAWSYASAILNILDDSTEEKARLAGTQRAILNILEDAAGERTRLISTERAVLNILDDVADEKVRLMETQTAALNILEDFDIEKERVRQRTAELEAANKELDAFAYSVSHDLRAPLRAIDGFSRLLEEDYGDRLDAAGHHVISRIVAGTGRMAQLIDDLLKLSRVSRGELRRARVDLSETVREVASNYQRLNADRSVEVLIASGVIAEGDPQLLRVALENLLGNAFKFTAKKPDARIEFGLDASGKAPVYFVRDNGAGFDPAYASKLFGAFQRLHSDAEFPGTGIGLATVKRIFLRHGGRTWAEGQTDRGATFYFTLRKE